MTFTLTGWLIYTMWAILGLMFVDFLVGLVKTLAEGTFHLNFALDYLKEILYYVVPLMLLVYLIPIDPTGWILPIGYFAFGLAVIAKYLLGIVKKFQ